MQLMRRLPALLLVAASGCAQLFGIDDTSGPNVDPSRVSLTIERWSIGAAVSKNPQDLSMETADFLVDDGAGVYMKLPGEHTSLDTLSAVLPTGTPPVLFTLPDVPTPYKRLWAMPARDRRGVFAMFEHPNPEEPLPSSQITLTATLPSAYVNNESFRIEAIGAWMGRFVMPAEPADGTASTITASMAYSTFGRMTNSPAARITSQDVVVLERYVGSQLTGVYQVPPFDQTDAADSINANVVPVTANRTLTATVTPATYAQRYTAVRPAVGGLGQSWVITAAPGWSIGSNVGPLLHAGGVAATDAMISAMYGNPFESLEWRSLLQFTTSATRTHMFQGMIAMTLSAGMYTVTEPSSSLTLDLPAGLPISISANQIPLSTDGATVMLDLTKPVVIEATIEKPNTTLYLATLYEVVLGMDQMTVERRVVVDAATTGEPKLRLPPELFQVGHYYYVDFRCVQGGYTNAATGDLQTLTLPYSVSRADSALFQVVAP
jgi:hypothetical protein